MKFGLRYCNTGPFVDAGYAVELAQAAEEAGFESLWTVEHTILPGDYTSVYPYAASGRVAGGDATTPLPDPLIWMSYIAAATKHIKLASGIIILPQHNPVITAKQVATLDHMSGGRIILGIGVGWLKEEFEALGVPFEKRGKRTDEYIEAMRELWSAEAPAYSGDFVSFKDAYCRPQPVGGTVPIVVGGHSKAAARRAGRLGDGFFPARGVPTELFGLVRETAEQAGRNPDDVEITVSMPDSPDEIPALRAAGVSRVTVPVSQMAGLTAMVTSPEDVTKWQPVIAQYGG